MSSLKNPVTALSAISVNKSSKTPIYAQIAEGLGELLDQAAFPAGFVLPAERWWCQHYGISRMTLRQAMGILERKGLIESHRGRGTFVANRTLKKEQQELRSFTEEIRLRGGTPHSRHISFELIAGPASVRDFFGLTGDEKVYEIKRLRLKDSIPLALETTQIPEKIAPQLGRFDFTRNSLYRILEETYNLKLETSKEEIFAQIPTLPVRKLLELPAKVAVLVINRKTFTESGQAIEFSQSIYRGDLYSALVHSIRKPKQ